MRPRGLILVVAAAGWGKSAWLGAHAPVDALTVRAERAATDVLAPDRAAGQGAGGLVDAGLVVEDLHELDPGSRADLLRRLDGLAKTRPVYLTSRWPLTADERMVLHGPVFERGPAELALTPAQVAALMSEEYDVADPVLPALVHQMTAGWPMLVHLVADAIAEDAGADHGLSAADVATAADRTCGPGSTTASWCGGSLRSDLSEGQAALLASWSRLDRVTPDLVAELGGDADPRATYETLVRTGVLVRHPRAVLTGDVAHRVVPAVAAAGGPTPEDPEWWTRAAFWYEAHAIPYDAVRAYVRAGDAPRARELLALDGIQMSEQGDAVGVVALLRSGHVGGVDSAALQRTLAEALRLSGDTAAAAHAYAPLVQRAEERGWDTRLAVQVAANAYSQGNLAGALAVLDRVDADDVGDGDDGIAWRAQRVILLARLGDVAAARSLVAEATRLAERSGRPAHLLAAHQAAAATTSGTVKAAHLQRALEEARRSGDVVTLARILCNQSFALLAAARCREAVEVGRDAAEACAQVRPVGALIAALHNLAEALCRTGGFDEARWHLRHAIVISQRVGPSRAAQSLSGLGDLHRALGAREQGLVVYAEAMDLARASGEVQVLVPALAGLARLLAADEPERARSLAEEALTLATAGLATYALIAMGWVELATGGRDRAAELAGRAVDAARDEQTLDLLAESLELGALAAEDDARARDLLVEAHAIWAAGGADPECWRLDVLLARLDGSDRDDRMRGREAAAHLQRLGVARAGDWQVDPVAKDVQVEVLGGFRVLVRGQEVPNAAWRSRQARVLVKVLAAHHGRPVSRGLLCEELWPDGDPRKTSHRLSVLLATVRTVLDPGKSCPADHYVSSDARGVWLDLRRIGVDADQLLADAEHGADLLAAGEARQAGDVLAEVDRRYRGDAFEDEPYEAWAAPLREETRAAWLRTLRHLATIATRDGRHNDLVALLVRLLAVDPYDAGVHRGLVRTLVRTGRYGEAKRAFDTWTRAMAEVGAPLPGPDVLIPR